jgi:MGT family glycosyltransferase
MGRFLFATWEGGGHVQPMLLVARGLQARGHEVLALSDACNATDAAALGVPFQPWRTAPSRPDKSPETDPLKDWLAQSPFDMIYALADRLMGGPARDYAQDTVQAIEAFDADAVISHELLFGVMAGAESKARPLAVFAAGLWSLPTLPGAPPFGVGMPPAADDEQRAVNVRLEKATRDAFQRGLPGLNEARTSVGLGPIGDLFDQLDAARRILIATSRTFDFDGSPPAPYRYVGPYLADPAWAGAWSPPWPEPREHPLVLVSFSSMYQAQEEVLRKVIEALGTLPVQGLVTLGPALSPADFPAPDNVVVVKSAPHSDLYPQAAAMVTHAGHGTALRPLMDGAPLLCIPLGRDQPDNAARVTERGAGLRLTRHASSTEIAEAVRRLIDEPAFAAAAAELGRRVASDMAAQSAEDELEGLLAVGAPA